MRIPTSLGAIGGSRRTRTAIAVAGLISLLGTTLAAAEEGDPEPLPASALEEPAEEVVEPASPLEYFPDPGAIVFSLPDEEGAFVDCSEAVLTVEPDGTITVVPVECLAAPAVGPNGQVNHGQIVRAYVHALKESGYEGPRGHLVRDAARSSFGKGDQKVGPSTDEATVAEATSSSSGPNKAKKDKPGRGRGRN